MSIESLAQNLESEYEGETGCHVATGSVYFVQYPTENNDLVREVEIDVATGNATGNEKIVQRKKYHWQK
jgi:hypothetical protein